MEPKSGAMLRIGDWCVNPATSQISRNGEFVRLDVRTMRLLLCLANHAGDVVSIDDLIAQVWSGVNVTPDSVYQAVASLRRVLGDDPKQPTYIETVPRLGYRMVAKVSPWTDQAARQTSVSHGSPADASVSAVTPEVIPGKHWRARLAWLGGTAVCLLLVVGLVFRDKLANNNRPASPRAAPQEKSVAVLPFLDLTEGMREETFADGITEELIDKLSRVPDLRVPPAASSFYYKDKQVPVADIAKSLGVAYILDGSVRKSGTWVRVDVRLSRGTNGFVIWSETYDQPMKDILAIQDDIAGKVTKALTASIAAGSGANPTQ